MRERAVRARGMQTLRPRCGGGLGGGALVGGGKLRLEVGFFGCVELHWSQCGLSICFYSGA